MTYFYDYYAKEYRESHMGKQIPFPAAIYEIISMEEVQACKRILRNAFTCYREDRNVDLLKRLLGEYRKYVSGCHDGHIKDRYNAFVYRFMVERHVGFKAIGGRLGVTQKTVCNYINGALDEMLILCMGIPAAGAIPEGKEDYTGWLIEGSRLFHSMADDYVISLFPGNGKVLERSRQITKDILKQLEEAARAYSDYCNDEHTCIDNDIRKAEILEKCFTGMPCGRIAEWYGCSEGTVYADINENEKRLAAMLF